MQWLSGEEGLRTVEGVTHSEIDYTETIGYCEVSNLIQTRQETTCGSRRVSWCVMAVLQVVFE